jgi:hypothetical protein
VVGGSVTLEFKKGGGYCSHFFPGAKRPSWGAGGAGGGEDEDDDLTWPS